jgi:futalosine hydrolase
LVPTELELRRIADLGGIPAGLALVELCGFGPVAAAARTAALLSELRPARALLLGIAGAYDPAEHPLGSASEFDVCAIEGLGVGEGRALLAPPALGFPQWPGREGGTPAIYDRVALATAPRSGRPRLLLTTCAASADPAQARVRRERFPDAVAEDMEGFAVASACALAGVPLRIVRGISNAVGDRAAAHWRIPSALAAARAQALELLESGAGWASSR